MTQSFALNERPKSDSIEQPRKGRQRVNNRKGHYDSDDTAISFVGPFFVKEVNPINRDGS